MLDVGANYWSVWNWHNEAAKNVLSYYDKYPEPIDYIARHIGYRVYPSFIWSFERDGTPGLVIGLANKGVAVVPGVLRLTVFSEDGKVNVSGCVDPGYPKPVGIRQAMLMLPPGSEWERLKTEGRTRGERRSLSGDGGHAGSRQTPTDRSRCGATFADEGEWRALALHRNQRNLLDLRIRVVSPLGPLHGRKLLNCCPGRVDAAEILGVDLVHSGEI